MKLDDSNSVSWSTTVEVYVVATDQALYLHSDDPPTGSNGEAKAKWAKSDFILRTQC